MVHCVNTFFIIHSSFSLNYALGATVADILSFRGFGADGVLLTTPIIPFGLQCIGITIFYMGQDTMAVNSYHNVMILYFCMAFLTRYDLHRGFDEFDLTSSHI